MTKYRKTYNYRKLREDLKLNYVPEEAFIPAFDAITDRWIDAMRKRHSTYNEHHTRSVVYFTAVNNIVVRVSFDERNMDVVDNEEDIMMRTEVHLSSEREEPLNTLMADLLKFKESCTEETVKSLVKEHLKRRQTKTYHLSRKIREYYGY